MTRPAGGKPHWEPAEYIGYDGYKRPWVAKRSDHWADFALSSNCSIRRFKTREAAQKACDQLNSAEAIRRAPR